MTQEEKKNLAATACKVRMGVIEATHGAKSGHPGGSLSAADLFTYLYFKQLRIDPKNPRWDDRDRFVLSKGHTAPGLYSALALRGFFPTADLPTLRHIGSYLQGHPNMNMTPARWARAFLPRPAWRWPPACAAKTTTPMHCWVTAKFKRARFGRPLCSARTTSWTT